MPRPVMLKAVGWVGSSGPREEGTHDSQRVEESGLIKVCIWSIPSS